MGGDGLMGLRGPRPAPSVLKKQKGDTRKVGVRKFEEQFSREPRSDELSAVELRSPPERLALPAREWWIYYADILARLRVLREADLIALENLANATSDRIAQEKNLQATGPLYKNGPYVQVSPLFRVVERLRNRELALLREFGLTPSSRSQVEIVGEPDDETRFLNLLNQPSEDSDATIQ